MPPTVVRAVIKPNSRKGPLVEPLGDGTLQLYVRAPAVEGRANKAAIELLAQHPTDTYTAPGNPSCRHAS